MSGVRTTVSGSFHRHMDVISEDVRDFQRRGVDVLSPADPRVVDDFGEFLFVASDTRRSIRGIQNRHLAAIAESSFLWLVCPDGYVGTSAAFEVGFAAAAEIPIFSVTPPSDLTLRQYVQVVSDVPDVIRHVLGRGVESRPEQLSLLLDPSEALVEIHAQIELVASEFHSARLPNTTRLSSVYSALVASWQRPSFLTEPLHCLGH